MIKCSTSQNLHSSLCYVKKGQSPGKKERIYEKSRMEMKRKNENSASASSTPGYQTRLTSINI